MHFKYPLSERLSAQARALDEFANGAVQCHARLHDGSVHPELLISGASAIIAMRGHALLPFPVESIAELFQEEEDKSPKQRGGWQFFDTWTLA